MIGMVLALAAAVAAPQSSDRETTIPFASNGGLRDWQISSSETNVYYVRDRADHWYRVALTGPCGTRDASETLTYTTNSSGTFDLFSNVSTARTPGQVCGVTSVRKSAPPPGIRTRSSG